MNQRKSTIGELVLVGILATAYFMNENRIPFGWTLVGMSMICAGIWFGIIEFAVIILHAVVK